MAMTSTSVTDATVFPPTRTGSIPVAAYVNAPFLAGLYGTGAVPFISLTEKHASANDGPGGYSNLGGVSQIIGNATVAFDGCYKVPVAISVGAVVAGDIIYVTAATGALTNVASGNVLWGYADEAGIIGSATRVAVWIARKI